MDQDDLFGDTADPGEPIPSKDLADNREHQPLAARMRPRRLAEVVGQDHILKEGALLPRLVAQNRFGSLIFYGPPGTGKTSIAEAIANETGSRFVRVNAVMSNVAELRAVLATARRRPEARTILFIDELHRFNKAQQDLLLPDVEEGGVRLIGATTHNPGFYDRTLAAFARAGVTPRIAEEVWPRANGVGLVRAGLGATFMCPSEARLLPPDVVFRPLVGPAPESRLVVGWRKGAEKDDPALRAFLAVAQAA